MPTFFVPGIPKPGGSKRAFINKKTGKVNVVDACKTGGDWRGDVKAFAVEHFPVALNGPVRLIVTFCMPRPKGHYGTGTKASTLKPSSPHWHTNKPDLTKLVRALEDALTGIAWRDDTQVVNQSAVKIYTNEQPGALINIRHWPEKGDE